MKKRPFIAAFQNCLVRNFAANSGTLRYNLCFEITGMPFRNSGAKVALEESNDYHS